MIWLSYKKLWKYLIDVDKTKNELREKAGISASTMSRRKKGRQRKHRSTYQNFRLFELRD